MIGRLVSVLRLSRADKAHRAIQRAFDAASRLDDLGYSSEASLIGRAALMARRLVESDEPATRTSSDA